MADRLEFGPLFMGVIRNYKKKSKKVAQTHRQTHTQTDIMN